MLIKKSNLPQSIKLLHFNPTAKDMTYYCEDLRPSLDDLRVRASSLKDIILCRAKPYFPSYLEEHTRTTYGTKVAAACEKIIKNRFKYSKELDLIYPNYIDYLKRIVTQHKNIYFNAEVALARRIKPLMTLTGTADFIWILGETCGIVDLKTGVHKVSVADNPQLKGYAFMLLNYVPYIKNFNLTIFQRRATTIKISTKEILKFGEDLKKIPTRLAFHVDLKSCGKCFNWVDCAYGRTFLAKMSEEIRENPKLLESYEKDLDSLGILKYALKNKKELFKNKNLFSGELY